MLRFIYIRANAKAKAIFTCRNEVVAKVIFLHLFVILFTGGVVCLVRGGWYPTRH